MPPCSITGSGTASSGASRIVAMQARSVADSEATNDSLTATSRIQRAYAASPGRDDANRTALGGANPRNEPVEGATDARFETPRHGHSVSGAPTEVPTTRR